MPNEETLASPDVLSLTIDEMLAAAKTAVAKIDEFAM
jgi:hypothetical protein